MEFYLGLLFFGVLIQWEYMRELRRLRPDENKSQTDTSGKK